VTALADGFADQSHDAQRVFRAVLDAFSHPGRIVEIPVPLEAPAPLNAAAAAFLLTLVDRETPLWLAPQCSSDDVTGFVHFHTGAPIVAERAAAVFAIASEADLAGFGIGTEAYPDRSATLVVQVPSLRGGPALTLRGPGIDGAASAAIDGLPASFVAAWAANHTLFPCGVDLVFAAGSELLALPRSIAVEA
jgi:alpha-D-ribose 1-methylphosphonate 5-triphosphate synthase subunit PhnH